MDPIKLKLHGKNGKDKYTLIDAEDFDRVNKHKWRLSTFGYVMCGGKLRLHRFIMDAKQGELVDHISMDKLDNRKFNLRIATKSQNAMNIGIGKRNKSGYKGVSLSNLRKGYWAAYIKINQKHKFLGHFKTKEEAAKAYNQAAEQYFKEFARTNIIKGGL